MLSSFHRAFKCIIGQVPRYRCRGLSSFSWTGPKSLEDILKKELLVGKSSEEVSDIWLKYHQDKNHVHGTVLKGQEGLNVLTRAKESPFFIQPIFRNDGFFILVSQFQADQHFLMTYLEDYKVDPARASPLLTFSVFVDYADDELDLTMIRTDVIAKTIDDQEALKVVTNMVDAYRKDELYPLVHTFNHEPEKFDFDDYISQQNQRWKK